MPLNSNPFIEGTDPTATFGGYASVLLQLIRQAKPSSTYGMILFDTVAPDVSGSNAWRKTCLWLNLATPASPTLNVYREGGSPGWININNVIGNGAISTAMISDSAVTLAKLSTLGGTPNQLIRVNSGGNAFEFVSLSNLVAAGTINPSALVTVGLPAAQFRLVGTYGPGTATWYNAQAVIDNLAEASIGTDLIAPAGSATSRSQFLTTRSGDPFAAWRYLDPSNDIQPNSINADRLTNTTLPLTKIIPATADAVLMTYGGDVDWVPPLTVRGSVTQFVTAVANAPALTSAIFTQGASVTLSHTLGVTPLMFRVTMYCNAPGGDGGYALGDEIDLCNIGQAGVGGDAQNPFMYFINGNASVVVRKLQTSTSLQIIEKSTANSHTINSGNIGNWSLRLYAMKVA